MNSLQPTASYTRRDYDFARIRGLGLAEGVLVLNVGRGHGWLGTRYACQCDRAEDGTLQTVYLAKMHSEDGEVYGVEFARDGRSRCSCLGYRRHGQCKHNDAVRDLLSRGELEFRRSRAG